MQDNTIIRRRGVALSELGLERFVAARRQLETEPSSAQRLTLERCAIRANVGLRTLTRCLSGGRVDRRSLQMIFAGVGLDVRGDDLVTHELRATRKLGATG